MVSSSVTYSSFPPHILAVLLEPRCLSTRKSYAQNWVCFVQFAATKGWPLLDITLVHVFDYIVHLKDSGLGFSSLKVILAALSAYLLQMDGFSVFSSPHVKVVPQRVATFGTPRRPFIPDWNLPLVLTQLMLPSFGFGGYSPPYLEGGVSCCYYFGLLQL